MASNIYFAGYGQCVQYAYLFVALCRAVNVPARTVSGITSWKRDSFWNAHQWTEFMDNDGFWHQVDASSTPPSFDLSDPRYFDFYYAEYQNSIDYWHYGKISIENVELDLLSCLDLYSWVLIDSFFGLSILIALDVGLVVIFLVFQKRNEKRI